MMESDKKSSDVENKVTYIKQYVKSVTDFTSQYGSTDSISYTAENIIGQLCIYPNYGDYPQAYIMRTYGTWWNEAPSGTRELSPKNYGNVRSQDYIDLSFECKVYATAVDVCETYNPGAVVRIWAFDGESRWWKLWEGPPCVNLEPKSRIFSPSIEEPPFPTNVLRIEFDHSKLKYHTELDGVILVGTLEAPSNLLSYTLPSGELTKKVMSLNLHQLPPANLPAVEEENDKNNPFHMLPEELILYIFSWLDLRSLCRCAQVNKDFLTAATDATLYTELNLKAYWWLVGSSCLTSLATRCFRLQALDLSWCGNRVAGFNNSFIRFLQSCGSNLKILKLNNCIFIDNDAIKHISEICFNLQELSVRCCMNVIDGWSPLRSCSNLTRLDMYHCLVTSSELLAMLPSMNQLKHLGLGAVNIGNDLDRVIELLPTYCPNLCSLDLWKAHTLSSLGLISISQLHKLEELDLGWCFDTETSTESLRKLAFGCPLLRKLFLSALRSISERELLLIAERCPKLEQLDVLGARGITPETCLRLLGQCKALKLLDVNYCDHITEAHVEQWRCVFPHIQIQYTTPPSEDSI